MLAASARAAEPVPVGQAREHISDLEVAYDTSWNWRDGDRRGSSIVPQGSEREVTGPPGLVSAPSGGLGSDAFVAAYSDRGRLSAVVGGKRVTVAKGRHGVGNERFADGWYQLVLGWVERHRRLYASVSRTQTYDHYDTPVTRRPFTAPQLLAKGRVRSMVLASRGSGSVVVWQDGRNRIRASVLPRRGRRFGRAFTVARADGPVSDLRVNAEGYRQDFGVDVLWSTASGVREADKPWRAKRFRAPTVLSRRPASGLAIDTIEGNYRAWGEAGRVVVAHRCDDGLRRRIIPTAGTPHLEDLTRGGDVAYTLAGTVYFEWEALGPGRDVSIPNDELRWINGGQVVKGVPKTPSRPSGEGAPDPCE